MKLGKFAELSIGATDLSRTLTFFERLGFEKLDLNWEPWPWAVITDGVLTANLVQFSGPSAPILSYVSGDMRDRVEQLKSFGLNVTPVQDRHLPEVVGAFETPCGIGLSFVEYQARRIPKPRGVSVSKCGVFGELAFPSPDVNRSLAFWQRLGFDRLRGSRLPYPWGVVTDDLVTLGLYQSEEFPVPALIYYSEDTTSRLEHLVSEGFGFSRILPSPDLGTARFAIEVPDGEMLVVLEHHPV
jgi:catechol 2,3-dioxygenase-like lactoylglutathione lyase family enzyme